MTIGLAIAVALGSGLASTLAGPRLPRVALWIGLLGALASLVIGLLIGDRDVLAIGTVSLASSATLRLVAVGWAAAALLLGIVGRVVGGASSTVGPSMLALGASLLALASDDPGLAFAALAAGAAGAILAPALGSWLADREETPLTTVALHGTAATVGAGLAGMLIVAWSRSAVGPFGGGLIAGVDDPAFRVAVSLGLLGMAGAVVVRGGAIPAHLWAARFVGGLSPLAVPASLAWGSAAFTLVALDWSAAVASTSQVALDDAARALVVLVALGSILLGGLAAILHDDLEHVLGYSIVQAAGVALLAFATLSPDADRAAGDWLLATASVASAMAAWIAVVRWTFGAHRVSELRGWARRSPALAIAAAAILVGLVGVPGMAVFGARWALATGAAPGIPGTLVVLAALSPVVALGRVLVAGSGRSAPEVAAAPRERLGVLVLPAGGWSRGGWSRGGLAWLARNVRATARANAALAANLAVVLLAVLGLALAVIGGGAAAS